MAEGCDVRRLRAMLECSICLEQFDNPKMLKCTHEFCKHCLEGIVTFRRDGSATITCPLRCDEQTLIHENQTVDSLAASYNLKNVLEALKMEDKQLDLQMPVCTYNGNCTKYVSIFCCGNLMCHTCYMDHVKTGGDQPQGHRKVNLSFNKRENKLRVICDKHVSVCDYFCTDNEFLCMYCMHRDGEHKQHSKNTIEMEVRLLKEALGNELRGHEKIQQFQTTTQQNILIAKGNFTNLLQQRKEECLSRYSEFLNEEEERLKKNFQTIYDCHMKEYRCGLSSEYYQVMLGKHDVELVLLKDEILDAILKNKNKLALKSKTISLTEPFKFLGGQPLGDIHVISGEDVPIESSPVPTLKHNLETKSQRSQSGDTSSTNNSIFTCTQTICDEKKLTADAKNTLPNHENKNEDVAPNDSALQYTQDLKSRGNEYFRRGMYGMAIDCYTKAIELCPSENVADLSIYYQNRAAANEELKRWTKVIEDCSSAIKLNPKYCKALHRRARAYKALDNKRNSFEDATAACLIEGFQNKHGNDLAYRIGKALGEELAAEYFEKLPLSLPPSNAIKSYLGSFNYDLFTVCVKSNQVEDSIYSEILKSMKNEDYDTVLNMCTKEINAHGKHKDRAGLLRGTLKMLIRDIDSAMDDFNEVISLDDNEDTMALKVDALIKRAYLKVELKDVAGIFSDYALAIVLDNKNANIYHHRGQLYLRLGLLEEAKVDFKKAMSLDDTFVQPRLRLGSCLHKIAEQTVSPSITKEANDIFDETTHLFPNCAEAWEMYGQHLLGQKRLEEASEKMDQAISLAPSIGTLYVDKALLLLQWKDNNGADKLVRKAIEVDEECYLAYNYLGKTELKRGNYEEAAEYFERAIEFSRTELEMANNFALLETAKARGKLTEQYGIKCLSSVQ